MKKPGIYLITNIENGKEYVGSTIQPFYIRWKQHTNNLKSGRHSNKHLQNSWKKYGESAFVFEVLEVVEQESRTKKEFSKHLERLEDYYINLRDLRNDKVGYNKWSADRQVVSEETKAKISASQMGHTISEETKAKISSANKGRPNALKGIPRSKETKEKISTANTG